MKSSKALAPEEHEVEADAAFYIPPPMTMERYAKLQGVSVEVIRNQVRNKQLPSCKPGKHRLVNTFELARTLLNAN